MMNRYVVLVHGFMRQGRNMRYLAGKLEHRGYVALVPNLPTVFQNVRKCSELLDRYLEEHLPDEERVVHFVGHSMGGLIIRDYLSRRVVEGLGRVVLIGTPNRGTRHGNRLLWFSSLPHILKSLPDLAEPGPDIALPRNVPAPEVGIVIGIRPDPVRRLFLRGANDGLVTVESVRSVNADDEILMPCAHEQLHWRPDTAEAICVFLETGKFGLKKRSSKT
jgi:pimeloyl-ACP methyl ester carboxylesterase